MKTTITLILLLVTSSAAFSPALSTTTSTSSSTSSSSSLAASRRGFFSEIGVSAAALSGLVTVMGPSNMAWAEPRAMYLTEPTDEFKENEAKAAAFKRQQLLAKKEFMESLEKLLGESENADALVEDLKLLQSLIAKNGGLPLGIKKEELYKMIRSKKAKGFWPTPVEVA